MFAKNYILSFLTIVFLFALPVSAQDRKVCIGAKVMYETDGLEGSVYDYRLEQSQAGKIIREYSDSIVVEWGDTKGIFQLGVRETSQYGCDGGWAYLNVEVVGDYAQFTQSTYSMCGGEGVTVEFNRSNFKAYEWVDKTVPLSGHITKPGRYELRTIDKNNCLLSSFVTVESNSVNIALDKDTMICTPGFTLYALNIKDNPSGTIYTWSTNEYGDQVKSIVVENHDMDVDNKYWVRAEYGGCSASDTLVVLACKEEPIPGPLRIPNTFTPNDDGENDVWNIPSIRDYPDCVIEVFDRWGRKVFTSTKGYTSPWTGLDAKGHYLPMETYYYIIHLNDGKTQKPILGTITIIR